MNYTKKRWIILIASCFINLCIGSIYAWSVFATPMAEYLSGINGTVFTAGTLAIVFTVTNSVGPITMITGGRINDKFGPKKVIFVGGLIFGIGMILSGFSKSLPMLILTYGIILGLGVGMVYGCTISNSVKFFPDKRGLVGGVTTAAYGFSSVIIPPIANSITTSFGITTAFKSIGIVFLIIVCGASFFIEKCPNDFVPEGWTPPVMKGKQLKNKDWKEMLSSSIFYVMIILLTCGAFYGLMCTSMASALAQNMIGMTSATAAIAVSVLALFNTAGRIVAGYISDKIGRINTLSVAFIISIVGLLCLSTSVQGDIVKFYIGISIIGVCFGSFMGVFPGFTVDQFGPKNNSVNYGIMFIGFAFAGYIGPTVMKNVYAVDGNYTRAFTIGIVMAIIGLGLTFVYRFVNNKEISKYQSKKIS
ncbi:MULTISPECIES: OFA family MFS transporter [unclassified Clostridioides]|uniref:L-lactate MFS transporter n=1 Tax=unclassified Clostridioides TaxID=2635829 RepID=UPI001D10F1A0|nr:OFA family MFS transporter [Clostridioides sp. ES-S-0171-01]MCC0689524.1 OFA family MFS transporter [Clostridioides sp. ES-S-0056-01]UDN54202.1 OFA family MFS transporter [Clostridioides sp. ES-S-0054-01]